MDLSQYTVESSGTLLDAAQAIAANRSRCVIVMNGSKASGVISEGDLVRALLRGTDIYSPMQPFIHHGISFLPKRDMAQALELFRTYGISLIPILNDDLGLEDVITLQQLLTQVELTESGSSA
ncbi:MAG: CBS domain-containing protein [Coriobacteriales bacterium]|jgi:CBS domain-containing protein|nr:CBS domain-containing protein [Coriobacteriales bacterium]